MRKLALAATAAALTLAALPSAANATDVCNEAENSWQGDYEMTETSDPRPPAFLRDKQMVVGNGKAFWIVYLETSADEPKIRAFRDWILAEATAMRPPPVERLPRI